MYCIPSDASRSPEDVARWALFPASDDFPYMTAANLVLDDGWSGVLPGAWPAADG